MVPVEGTLALACRARERITIDNQVGNAQFYGHTDTEELSDYVLKMLADRGLPRARLGIDKRSLFMTPRIYELIITGAPKADWSDGSGIIHELRLVKSPLEQDCTRRAAADAGRLVYIGAAPTGAEESAALAMRGMQAICDALRPGATAARST